MLNLYVFSKTLDKNFSKHSCDKWGLEVYKVKSLILLIRDEMIFVGILSLS